MLGRMYSINESFNAMQVIVEHPNYMAQEDKIKRMDYNEAFFRESQEKSQFSPDITPLVLSAHYNNHEIIQLFLARKHTIEKPHVIACQCRDCQVKQKFDSLKRSRSRLNAYRALASPAYIVLSSPDPIMTTFELRQEMMALAEIEKEFKVTLSNPLVSLTSFENTIWNNALVDTRRKFHLLVSRRYFRAYSPELAAPDHHFFAFVQRYNITIVALRANYCVLSL